MSIEYEINRISTNVRDTLSAISEMGGEVPDGATSDDMAASVRSIPIGAKIDDTISSTTTTYSSSKIEEVVTNLNEANAAQNTEINKKANNADLAKVAKSGSYDDLTAKPTIPTVPTTLPNPNALTFTGAVSDTYDGSVAKSVAIPVVPEALKNPNKLILSGAVTAEYDGSTEVSVDIPAGSVKTVAGVSPDAAGNVALTAADVGAVAMELLWENATPNSEMGADADGVNGIELNWAAMDYTHVLVTFVYGSSAGNNVNQSSAISEIVIGKRILLSASNAGYDAYANRGLAFADGGLHIGGASSSIAGAKTNGTANAYIIPLKVYGIKGVRTNGQ